MEGTEPSNANAGGGQLADSRHATEEELRSLRYQEGITFDKLVYHDGTAKELALELGAIMERRIELLDVDYPITQICTIMRRALKKADCKIANTIDQYLPEKWKDPNRISAGILGNLIQQIDDSPVELGRPLDQLSISELETLLAFLKKTKNNGSDKLGTYLNNRIDAVRKEGLKRGVELLGEKYRDQISARDYRWEIPDDADLAELNQERRDQMDRVIHEYQVFRRKMDEDQYPAPNKEIARKHANSLRVYANMMHIINEEKYSGEIIFWLDRNYWKKVQSAHDSGNSTFFPTTLCARCSANIDEDPKDFHVSKYDKTSPTGYRCDNCQSTEILDRYNSREQVGDKSPEVDRMAADIVNHLEHYVDVFKDTRDYIMNPAIYARKRAISNEFRIASMGKEKMVLDRKIVKQD